MAYDASGTGPEIQGQDPLVTGTTQQIAMVGVAEHGNSPVIVTVAQAEISLIVDAVILPAVCRHTAITTKDRGQWVVT
jgi:hypothetical protein